MSSSSSEANVSELREILARAREKGIGRIEPVLKAGTGLVFRGFEDYDYARLAKMMDLLVREQIAAREPAGSLLSCGACGSYRLTAGFLCMACRSANVSRGSVIEHLTCGNVDIDENYYYYHHNHRNDNSHPSQEGEEGEERKGGEGRQGSLVCRKCGKRLNAIGVDYARPGSFFKCADCAALLPNADVQYACIQCGHRSAQDELRAGSLPAYSIDADRLSAFIAKVEEGEDKESDQSAPAAAASSYLKPIVETLNKIGIRSSSPAEVAGRSKVKHSFELAVYNDEGVPIMVADTLRSRDGKGHDEAKVMEFHARCDDLNRMTHKPIERLLVAVPGLRKDAGELASAYGISVIESKSRAEAVSGVVQAILRAYTSDKKLRVQ